MAVKLGNGNWAVKEDKLLAYNDNSGLFFNKEFDFSRGTSATYVAKDGLIKTAGIQPNIVNNGDFATDSDWNLSNAAIEDGVAKIQDSQGGFSRIRQNTGFTGQAKVTYTISFNNSSNTTIKLRSYGGLMVNNALPATVGTHTVYEDFASGAISFQTGLAAGEEIHLDNVSVQEIQTDTPRIDFTNDTKGHLLLEPQSTNLMPYSEDFTQWSTSDATISSSSFNAPDGTQNASILTTSASGGTVQNSLSVNNGNVTFSVFVKKGSTDGVRLRIDAATDSNGYFDLVNNTVHSSTNDAKIENYGSGWYRVSISDNITSFVKASIYTTDGTTSYDNGTLHIWGAQLEDLSYATSYIPTTGATSTRNADVCNNSGSAQDFNDSEGVLYAEVERFDNDTEFTTIGLNNSSGDNQVSFKFRDTTNLVWAVVKSGGVNQAIMQYTASDLTVLNKLAIKYKENDFALWFNGVQVVTDTSGSAPTGLDELVFSDFNDTFTFTGKTKALAVFKEALTDEQLEKLTS